MNKKAHRELLSNWAFVILAAFIGFFVSIAADAAYDLIKGETSKEVYGALTYGILVSLILIRLFSWMFENVLDKKDERIPITRWLYYEWKESPLIVIGMLGLTILTLLLLLKI